MTATSTAGFGSIRNSTTADPADNPRVKIISPKSLSKVSNTRASRSQISATASSDSPASSSAMEDTWYPQFRSAVTAGRGKFSSARNFTQSPEDKLVRRGEAHPRIEGTLICPAQISGDNSQESAGDSSPTQADQRQIPRRFECRQSRVCRQESSGRPRFSLSVPPLHYPLVPATILWAKTQALSCFQILIPE